jgi:peptidoglycan/LPS O-acetylase OafA/YrhL
VAEDLPQADTQTAERRNELGACEVQRSQTKSEMTDTGAATHKNLSIQCLRGMAALFVALFHASAIARDNFGDSGWAAAFDGRFGLVGVAVFFAISGLLMADLIQRTDPWRFLAHRVVRIYPTYLLTVSVLVPIIGFLGIRKFGPHVFSLMLVPAGHRTYYLGVEWTLVFECTYYVALFLIALVGWRRHLNRIALIWIAVILAAPLFIGWSDSVFYPFYSIWLSPANAAFAGGLLIPWIASRMRIPLGTGLLATCILMVAVPANPMVARWAAGGVATLLVMDAVRIKMPHRATLGLPKLGDWSYALYLCQLIVSAGLGMLDVQMYRRLKYTVDNANTEYRRRRLTSMSGRLSSRRLSLLH